MVYQIYQINHFMKSKFITKLFPILLLLFIGAKTKAQVAIGPKAGLTLSTFVGNNAGGDAITFVLGFQAGASAQIKINETFSILPELLYFQKGTRTEFFDMGFNFEIEDRINYIEIPVLAKFIVAEPANTTQLYLTGGPSLGIGVNVNVVTEEGEEEGRETKSFDEKNLKRLDIAATIGAGVQFPVGSNLLTVDIRYLYGLSSIDDTDSGIDFRNSGVNLAVAYLFRIGG